MSLLSLTAILVVFAGKVIYLAHCSPVTSNSNNEEATLSFFVIPPDDSLSKFSDPSTTPDLKEYSGSFPDQEHIADGIANDGQEGTMKFALRHFLGKLGSHVKLAGRPRYGRSVSQATSTVKIPSLSVKKPGTSFLRLLSWPVFMSCPRLRDQGALQRTLSKTEILHNKSDSPGQIPGSAETHHSWCTSILKCIRSA